jgi:hypothetical protein
MKITKFIPLSFPAGANSRTTAYISVPFKVRSIHIKSAGYRAGTLGTTNYVGVLSDLFPQNAPLGIFFQDTTYSSGTIQDIEHQQWNPVEINGTYNFWLVNMDGSGATATVNGDKVGFIIEFNGPDEIL